MVQYRKWFLMFGLLLEFGNQAYCEDLTLVDEGVKATITENVSKLIPGFTIRYISRTPIEGLYSIQVEKGPRVFINIDGTFIINEQGEAVVPNSNGFVAWTNPIQSLIDREVQGIANISLNEIPKDELIVFPAKGEKKGHIFVFTDVDCGACFKLHLEVPKMNEMGIEVRYLAFPRSGPVGVSADKLARAFCAEDRAKALTELKNGGGLEREICIQHPIHEHLKLVEVLGLRGTPSIFLQDGRKVYGYRTAEKLLELIFPG